MHNTVGKLVSRQLPQDVDENDSLFSRPLGIPFENLFLQLVARLMI